MAGTYTGKVCTKHPEAAGERKKSNRTCVACSRATKRAWAKEGRNRDRVMTMIYSRLRKQGIERATPPWADRKAITSIYASRGPGQVIDHIVPLKGIDPETGTHVVCGLHVENNLAVADKSANSRKWAWFTSAD